MYVTEEGYLFTRDITKVKTKNNKLKKFIRNNRISIIIASSFITLVIIEGILLNQFITMLKYL